jgi:hypothetical protein
MARGQEPRTFLSGRDTQNPPLKPLTATRNPENMESLNTKPLSGKVLGL